MKFGVCLPYMEEDYWREDILEWCRRIDQGPFSSLSCGERITGYTCEMRVLLAAAAAVTERVRIVPSLYVLPMHSPVWAAKEIATLDLLSQGRVTVTVGVGGRENDYKAVGAPFEGRFQRLDDHAATMKRIWAGEPPFAGADPVGPRPVQDGGPPLLVGAMGPKSINRISKWADGLYGFAMNGERDLISYFKTSAEDAWTRHGRDSKPYFMAGFWCSLADNAEERLKRYVFNYLRTFGDAEAAKVAASMTRNQPGAVLQAIDEIAALGVDEIMLVPATADISEIDRLETLLVKNGLV